VNGDGFTDLATANFDTYSVSVLLGAGDGSFQGQRVFETGGGPSSVAAADVNGDGFADLVAGDVFSYGVAVLLGDGTGSFEGGTRTTGPVSLAVADVNGDRAPDLV